MKIKIKAKSINGIQALQKVYYDSNNIDESKLTKEELQAVKFTEVSLIKEHPYTLQFNYKKIILLPGINKLIRDYNQAQREQVIKNTIKMINDYNCIEMEYDVE